MLAFEFLPARHGDCFLVRWGDPERIMVVDGGPDEVYERVLRPRLAAIPPGLGGAPIVDVLCLTHVDDDHVVGVARLLRELVQARRDQLPAVIDLRRVWFNSVEDLISQVDPTLPASVYELFVTEPGDASRAASYAQGRDIRNAIAALALEGNPPFGDSLTSGLTKPLYELEISVVAPGKAAIAQLTEKWRASLRAKTIKPIAAAYIDRSVPNLSSIVLHLRHLGRTALLTGDARGDHLLDGLESAGLLDSRGTIHVDVFKLPHHGSEHNAAPTLFKRIQADHYVISADGVKHAHPSSATLEWLVYSRAAGDLYTIHLTNRIPAAEAVLAKLAAGRSFKVSAGGPNLITVR